MRGDLLKCKSFLIYSPVLASQVSSSPILRIRIWSIEKDCLTFEEDSQSTARVLVANLFSPIAVN